MKSGHYADVFSTLFGLSVAWAAVSMLLVFRQWRKMGLTPRGRLEVLSGPRPSDPDELFMWRWFFSLCIAVLLGVSCVLLLVFTS
jgi:hypothetical protein